MFRSEGMDTINKRGKRARKRERMRTQRRRRPSFDVFFSLLNLNLFQKKKTRCSADRPLRLHPDHPRPGHAVHGAQAEPGAAAVADVKKKKKKREMKFKK